MTKFGAFFFLVLTLAFCGGHAQGQVSTTSNSVGLIVLSKNYGDKDFIQLYNEDGSVWYRFSFYYDDSDGKFEYANAEFQPFAFHPDYFLLALKCVRREVGRYQVIVNEETGLRKYAKAGDPSLRFERWEDHMLTLFSVGFDRKVNPVRETPHGRVKTVVQREVSFQPVAVRGEWLRVKWEASRRASKEGLRYASGWVRWKQGQRLLIELFYIS
jgi:hypothetical protein